MIRSLFIIACIVLLNPPLISPNQFYVLVFALPFIIFLPIRFGRFTTILLLLAMIGLSSLTEKLLPHAAIEEGHQVYITTANQKPKSSAFLPPEITAALERDFISTYGLLSTCDEGQGCWRPAWQPTNAFAFSSDSLFHPAKYSRTVHSIHFDGLETLRPGFTNTRAMNREEGSTRIKRTALPHFVFYELPEILAGSELCSSGETYWQKKSAGSIFLKNQSTDWNCQTLTAEILPAQVFGLALGKKLAMKLNLSSNIARIHKANHLIRLLLVLATLALGFRLVFNFNFLSSMGFLVLTLSFWPAVGAFSTYSVLAGGNDGLAYEYMAHEIVESVSHLDWLSVLRGGEDIYNFLPGMRYFKALQKIIFGDNQLGYCLVLCWLPYLIYSTAKSVVARPIAILMALVFLLPWPKIPILRSLYWQLQAELGTLAFGGFSEPMASFFVFLGLAITLSQSSAHTPAQKQFFGTLCLALAVFIRPNFGVGLIAFVAVSMWRSILPTLLGLFPLALPVTHNWYFGKALYLVNLTQTGAMNLILPPKVYLEALSNRVAFDRVVVHWFYWMDLSLWISAFFLTIPTLFILTRAYHDRALLYLFALWAGLQFPSLFYVSNGRYRLVAWQIATLLLVGLLVRLWRQWQTGQIRLKLLRHQVD